MKYSQEKINVQGDAYPKYPDLIISHCTHVSKYHIYPINIYKYYTSFKKKNHAQLEEYQENVKLNQKNNCVR